MCSGSTFVLRSRNARSYAEFSPSRTRSVILSAFISPLLTASGRVNVAPAGSLQIARAGTPGSENPAGVNLVEGRAARLPPAVRDGAFHAYYVYDVADTIALERLVRLAGAGVAQAPLQLRREASSGFIGFPTPPVVARIPHAASDIGIRAKLYDYGVVSIRLSLPFAGPWNAFAAFTRRLRNDDDLSQLARRSLDGLLAEIGDALDDPHPPLIEDYFVFEVESFAAPVLATELLGEYASALASLVLCEERPLMPRAQEEALRANFSYFDDDLTVVQWDTA